MLMFRDVDGSAAGSETTQSPPPKALPVPAVFAAFRMVFAMRPVAMTAARFDDAAGQRECKQ